MSEHAQRNFLAYVNPLTCHSVDPLFGDDEPTLESIVGFLCTPGTDLSVTAFAQRYRDITGSMKTLAVVPHEQRLLEKLVWPLRHAKASYMTGNYLGAIALCGMVAEMVAILLFQLSEVRIGGRVMSNKDEANVFGREFERLGQERRASVLVAFGMVDESTFRNFEDVRGIRNNYLHWWSRDHNAIEKDAIKSYRAATELVALILVLLRTEWEFPRTGLA